VTPLSEYMTFPYELSDLGEDGRLPDLGEGVRRAQPGRPPAPEGAGHQATGDREQHGEQDGAGRHRRVEVDGDGLGGVGAQPAERAAAGRPEGLRPPWTGRARALAHPPAP